MEEFQSNSNKAIMINSVKFYIRKGQNSMRENEMNRALGNFCAHIG